VVGRIECSDQTLINHSTLSDENQEKPRSSLRGWTDWIMLIQRTPDRGPPSMSEEAKARIVISDTEFVRQLRILRRTRRFLIEEGVAPARSTDNPTPFSLGFLNQVQRRFPFEKGIVPELRHWNLLEETQDSLQRYFTPELQRRFRLRTTQKMITWLPLGLLIIMFAALGFSVFASQADSISIAVSNAARIGLSTVGWQFASYLVWTSCLGGLGAVSFLAVNSLAIQNDATFDLSNHSLVLMRIILGGLFGCIVSLPFCFPYFKEFTAWVVKDGDIDSGRGILLLVPFLLGFSTTLVMAVLNRMISGIETMFGIERKLTKQSAALVRHRDAEMPVGARRSGAEDAKPAAPNPGDPTAAIVTNIAAAQPRSRE
jgi:hypothetical protein